MLIAGIAALSVACRLLIGVMLDDRREAPLADMGVASDAVIAAGAPEVRLWAGELASRARSALDRGRDLQDRELSGWRIFRDFRPARAAFAEAHLAAVRAMHTAVRERRSAGSTIESSLQRASRAVAGAVQVAETLRVAGGQRLMEARIALRQARWMAGSRDYAGAAAMARKATQEARKAAATLVARVERYRDPGLVRQWREWEASTIAASRRTGRRAVVIVKEENELNVFDDGRLVARFPADMGSNGLERKTRSGDRATPEGVYRIVQEKGVGRSKYHRALLLDYPSSADRRRLRAEIRAGRLPAGTQPGNLIEIHGDGGRGRDWTDGCVALSNPDMDRLAKMVGVGTTVTIIGGRGHGGKFTALLDRSDRQAAAERLSGDGEGAIATASAGR